MVVYPCNVIIIDIVWPSMFSMLFMLRDNSQVPTYLLRAISLTIIMIYRKTTFIK